MNKPKLHSNKYYHFSFTELCYPRLIISIGTKKKAMFILPPDIATYNTKIVNDHQN